MDRLLQFRGLARRIGMGACVLALGPGASTDSASADEIPLTVKLAKELASDQAVASTQDLNCGDLRHVSQVCLSLSPDLCLLQERVIEFFRSYKGATTDFHRDMAALPFRVFITTTPDDFMYNALLETGKRPRRDFYNFRRVRQTQLSDATPESPLVYHLYGYPDEPDSLVVTENDLIDFLVKVVRNEPPLPHFLRKILSLTQTTCLFVDLGFKNWYLRALLKALDLHGHDYMSIALEEPEFFASSQQHQTTVYFSTSKAIQFRQDSLGEFARDLRASYETAHPAGQIKAPDLPRNAPLVFVSYASQDRDQVESMADRLRAAGIAIWQDKNNLRGGDDWSRTLHDVIHKVVNYVIVFQTTGMECQEEGYFYKEIRAALGRQQGLRAGARFVIPVQTGTTNVLPDLQPLHSISLDDAGGVEALKTTILEDWNRRAKV